MILAFTCSFGPPFEMPSAVRAASMAVHTWPFQPAPDWFPASFCCLRICTTITSSASVQQQLALVSFFYSVG
jgi:hypothetical protein